MSSVLLVILCYSQPPPLTADEMQALFDQADAQWTLYMKSIQGLEFQATHSYYQGNTLKGTSQSTHSLFKGSYISSSRQTFPINADQLFPPHMPNVLILRPRKDYYEEFQFTASQELTTNKDLSLATLPKSYEWYVPHEKTFRIPEHEFLGTVADMYYPLQATGYALAGRRLSYHQILYPPNRCTVRAIHQGNLLLIDYKTNPDHPTLKYAKTGRFKIDKKRHWMITDCEITTSLTTSLRTVSSTKFTKHGDIDVPLVHEVHYFERSTEPDVLTRIDVSQFVVRQFDDQSVLSLDSYGIPERELPPPTEPVPFIILSKTEPPNWWQSIPLWAYFTLLLIPLLYLVIRQLRKPRLPRI